MKSQFKQATIKVKDLVPNPKNPRIDLRPGMPVYDKLKNSIEHFGYLDPIIWNKRTGMIVSGHQRFQVMKDIAEENGEPFDEIDVMEVDMPENKQDSFMVAINKITGFWDMEKLATLFKELEEEDLKYTGYDSIEIDNLLEDDEENIIIEDEDYTQKEQKETFRLTLYFDNPEDMDVAYNKLTEEGYNVKK